MKKPLKSIILIGFKHVGKSAIGRELALQIRIPFIDLDQEIEREFRGKHQEKHSCRQIMNRYGQPYFRKLEKQALAQVIASKPSIIALGGGTPMDEENQKIINEHIIVHVIAPLGVVYERIMVNGRPVFYSKEEPALESFHRLWHEREKVYQKLASFTINNKGSVVSCVEQVRHYLITHSKIEGHS